MIFKSEIKEFGKFKQGKMFTFAVKDQTGQINIAFTKETEKFFEVIQFNRTYELQNL